MLKKIDQTLRITKALPRHLREQLALCHEYPQDVLFLDIETTGLSHYYDEITIIGWSLGGKASTVVKGATVDDFRRDASRAKVMITFNGIRFDQRFIKQEIPGIELPTHHIDLMYLCRRVGLKGGQKAIERELKLSFREGLGDVDGFAAVLLWHEYLRGDVSALQKLIRYNRADVGAMGAIFDSVLQLFTFERDLFQASTRFVEWAAPENWLTLPNVDAAASHLVAAPHFDELLADTPAGNATIVGIDLTGSEAKGSGWSLLHGKDAECRLVFADADLIAQTLAAKPDLVSIDSPLSLPFGRTTVEDSDPGRDEFGIMRRCERELKRRGVNVYPCLLPSMQKLTARGIRLATILRQLGVPVIESYPGAAQDIMRIPRKGAGIEWLKLGLGRFGIRGGYLEEKVSHDELDAITSALVGSFHLANLTEALGDSDEAPLIIPNLAAKPGPFAIGVSGPIASGKTSFARELESRGFAYVRFSEVLDDLLRDQSLELTRENRQKLGAEINTSGRQRWLAEQTLKRVENAEHIVIDGLRFGEDHAFFAEHFGGRFKHIYILTDDGLRRDRYSARDDSNNFDEVSTSEVESGVAVLKSRAHEIFSNDGSQETLSRRVTEIVQELDKERGCQSQSL
ncbi:ribonuclease H-like domain-containing protein [Rhizobium ruizarguesonis]